MSEDELSYADAATLYQRLEAEAATRRTRHHRSPVRPALLVMASVVAVVLAVAGARLIGGGQSSPETRPATGPSSQVLGYEAPPIGTDPFVTGGRRIAPERASAVAGFAVPTPDAPLANPQNLSVVWYSPVPNGSGSRGEIVLDYVATQIRIEIVPANRILRADPRAAFQAMTDEAHMAPGAMTNNGDPALVSGGSPSQPGFAQVVHNGLNVAVMGHRSTDELLSIARTLYQD